MDATYLQNIHQGTNQGYLNWSYENTTTNGVLNLESKLGTPPQLIPKLTGKLRLPTKPNKLRLPAHGWANFLLHGLSNNIELEIILVVPLKVRPHSPKSSLNSINFATSSFKSN